jgi:hypothetical protein
VRCQDVAYRHGADFGLSLVVRLFQVVVDVSDSFQSLFDVVDWAGFRW